jgi:hypothetical protein
MKYVKMLGLAAVAAMALTALVGAGTASAGTVACTSNTSPCATEYTGAIESSLKTGTAAVLTNSLDKVTCTESSMNGKITVATNASGNSTGEITAVTFSGCTDQNGASCTATAGNLAWHAEATATEISGKPNGNGKMTVKSGGSGNPQATVVCGSGNFLNCTFGVESATVDVIGGSQATIKTTELTMTKISGFLCPKEAKWDAEYTVSTPSALFLI